MLRWIYRTAIEPLVTWLFLLLGRCPPAWRARRAGRLRPVDREALPESARRVAQGSRMILALDGGGVRGIITLHCLRALERAAGVRCVDLFDMFAGTSTGAIIAAGLAYGIAVDDLIALYRTRHRQIFTRTLLGRTRLIVPKYRSEPLRCILASLFGDATLADCARDIFITATDTVRTETTYFTAFHAADGSVRGTYADVAIRAAVAASAAAPIYFSAVGRFIDGGIGAYNNPSYAAPVEALRYSGSRGPDRRVDLCANPDDGGPWVVRALRDDTLYAPGSVQVWSFGTGQEIRSMAPGQAAGIRLVTGWPAWLVGAFIDEAGRQQSYIAREELQRRERAITYTRFQIEFTARAMEALRTIDPTLPVDPAGYDLDLDAVSSFPFFDRVGQAFAAYLARHDLFAGPGCDLGRLDLVPVGGDIEAYARKVKDELRRLFPPLRREAGRRG